MGGILQHHAEVFEEETIAQRRFDADVGGDAGEHQVANTAAAQNAVERGIGRNRCSAVSAGRYRPPGAVIRQPVDNPNRLLPAACPVVPGVGAWSSAR